MFRDGDRIVTYQEALSRVGVSTAPRPPGGPAAEGAGGSSGTGARIGKDLGSALETTVHEVLEFLQRPIWSSDPNSLPTGVVLGLGLLAVRLLRGKRRGGLI